MQPLSVLILAWPGALVGAGCGALVSEYRPALGALLGAAIGATVWLARTEKHRPSVAGTTMVAHTLDLPDVGH